jgi:hypothetical protein
MKTTIEVKGFEIKIEELEGKITVTAEKDGEVMEEFELEAGEEVAGEEGEEMMPFGEEEGEDFGQAQEEEEEEEFGQAQEEDEEEFGQAQEEEEEGKLESFNSFIKKRNK